MRGKPDGNLTDTEESEMEVDADSDDEEKHKVEVKKSNKKPTKVSFPLHLNYCSKLLKRKPNTTQI